MVHARDCLIYSLNWPLGIHLFLFSLTQMVAFYSRTSRNRRKAEQKKWKLKKGSPYEDFALIAALSKIITAVDIMRGNKIKCVQ